MTSKADDVNKIMEYLIQGDDAPACLWEGDVWPGADELLENMFSLEEGAGLLDPLPDLPLYPERPEPAPASSCSDSGLSSDHADLTDYDQQLSPFLIQNTCADDPSASPSRFLSPLHSDSHGSPHYSGASESSPIHSGESQGSPRYCGPESRGSPRHGAGESQGSPRYGATSLYSDGQGAALAVSEAPGSPEFGAVEIECSTVDVQVKPAPKIVYKETFHNSPARKRRSSLAPNTAVVQPKLQKSAIVHSPVTVTSKPQMMVNAQPQKPLKLANIQVISPQPRVFSKPNEGVPQRKVIRVAPMAGNPRSILLPVTFKDMKDLRSIKIINAADLKNASNIKLAAASLLSQSKMQEIKMENVNATEFEYDSNNATMDDSMSDGSDEEDWHAPEPTGKRGQYPRLLLTPEERKLLSKEGIKLPASYPLTKHEERELKRIRRKIRNKISAQDSRKRKKEYVDGLEDRVKQCSEENQTLIKRIKILQSQNQSLTAQLKRLQHVLSGGGGGGGSGKGAQPATCLLVLLMSVALVALPSLREAERAPPAHTGPHALAAPPAAPALALRRALLSAAPHKVPSEEVVVDDGEFNMEELLSFPKPHSDHDYQVSKLERTITSRGGLPPGYLDIPIDEDWPPNLKHRIKDHFDLDDGPDHLPVIKEEDYEPYHAPHTMHSKKMAPNSKMDDFMQNNVLSKDYVVDLGGKIGELMPMVAVKNEDIITEEVDHDGRNVTELRSFVVNGTNRM